MQDSRLKIGYNYCASKLPKELIESKKSWKSVVNLAKNKDVLNAERSKSGPNVTNKTKSKFNDYYKRYDHDEVPVKDYANLNENFANDLEIGDNDRASLTNSELERIEKKVYNNISQELQTNERSISTLESNIKLIRATVQEIFDNFNTNMRDFELYKKKFHEILAKNQAEQIGDMKEFLKDIIHHIMSSESSLSPENNKLDIKNQGNCNDGTGEIILTSKKNGSLLESLHSVVEAYKNENYLTDSTLDENSSKIKTCTKKEIFNIYLLSGMPFVQIKMNDRNLLSEINIKDPTATLENSDSHIASAENLKRLAAKKIELEQYVKQQQDLPEREIPVKVSFAKNNIHMNEDFTHDKDLEDNKSFMAKICSYICKKFRKNSFV
ncbi:uncharacterized protein LOC131841193 [Achroia grisella]|uniref:uncharacterized protein LOC131841193 n=1 Tax=Achroia grisella TaxID=688607 RepID=UPI0027D2E380|nr:uncharacterized protein LOC131841193 [Achroia grisella]XP_059045442.1 uncharacterized protein LOC131841193 [Achroia grisella]